VQIDYPFVGATNRVLQILIVALTIFRAFASANQKKSPASVHTCCVSSSRSPSSFF